MYSLSKILHRHIQLILLVLATGVATGCASEPEHCVQEVQTRESSVEESVNEWFGAYVVTPIYKVLFFDVSFWDNQHPKGYLPSVPSETDKGYAQYTQSQVNASGATVRGYDEASGEYQYGCRVATTADAVVPVIPDGTERTFGQVSVVLKMDGGELTGLVQEKTIDLSALGLTLPETPAPTEEGSAVIEELNIPSLAPFPVLVDKTNGLVKSSTVSLTALRAEIAPLAAGMSVEHNAGMGEIAAIERRKVNLWTGETWTSSSRLERPADQQIVLPIVVLWLVLGSVFFTFRFVFINIRAFGHAIMVTAGRYDEADEPGEVSHFQALSSALSATVGLGNIAGVAIAVSVGGAGAIFWMVVAGILGMSSKFAECTLGQMYRVVKADGSVSGGPMHYLSDGLKEMKLGFLGKGLAVMFALMCIGGSFGGGNMFQGNQSFQAIADVVPGLTPSASGTVDFARRAGVPGELVIPKGTKVQSTGWDGKMSSGASFQTTEVTVLPANENNAAGVAVEAVTKGWKGNVNAGDISIVASVGDLVSVSNPSPTKGGSSKGKYFGIFMALAVGVVIIGGIKRIGAAAGIIVPAMCGLYVLASLYILLVNFMWIDEAMIAIFKSAFSWEAGFGGLVGVLITGFRRASFSNEAGIGSASIAHSAAATSEPVREGIVALLEPFIDTVIVCTMTGLVIVIYMVANGYDVGASNGITLTSMAFQDRGLSWFPMVLACAVCLFAFSTMISWSYYGERASTWLLGDWAKTPYKVLFLLCAFLGPVLDIGNVLDFSDLMVLGMAFPNILGVVLLSNKVGGALKEYMAKLKAGKFDKRAA